MSDIIDRLRDEGGYDPAEDLVRDPVCREAIDEIVALRCAMLAADERMRIAERRVWGDDRTDGCDAPDAMADEIVALRERAEKAEDRVAELEAALQTSEAIRKGAGILQKRAEARVDVLEAECRASRHAMPDAAVHTGDCISLRGHPCGLSTCWMIRARAATGPLPAPPDAGDGPTQ